MLVLEPIAEGAAPALNPVVYLPSGTFTLGRPVKGKAAAAADILLHGDSSISKIHATISVVQVPETGPDGPMLGATVKEQSRFGTFVDGDRVEVDGERGLTVGSEVKFGYKTLFRLRVHGLTICTAQALDDDSPHREAAGRVGARVTTCMGDKVSHVMVEENSMVGAAVLAGVLMDKPIVTPAWLHHIAGSGPLLGGMPSEGSFSPASMQLPPYPLQHAAAGAASQRLPPASQYGAAVLASLKQRLSADLLAGKVFANAREEDIRYLLTLLGAQVPPVPEPAAKGNSGTKPTRGRRGRSAATKAAAALPPPTDIQLVDETDAIYLVADVDAAKAFLQSLTAKQKKSDISFTITQDLLGCLARGVHVMSRVFTLSGTGAVEYKAVANPTQPVGATAPQEVIDIDDVTDEETGGDETDAEEVVELPAPSAAAPAICATPAANTIIIDADNAAQTIPVECQRGPSPAIAAPTSLPTTSSAGVEEDAPVQEATLVNEARDEEGAVIQLDKAGGNLGQAVMQGGATAAVDEQGGSTQQVESQQQAQPRRGFGRFRGALASLFNSDMKAGREQDPMELLASSLRGSGTQAVAPILMEAGVDAKQAQHSAADGRADDAGCKSVHGGAEGMHAAATQAQDTAMGGPTSPDGCTTGDGHDGNIGKRKRIDGVKDGGDDDGNTQHTKVQKTGSVAAATAGGWLDHTAVVTPRNDGKQASFDGTVGKGREHGPGVSALGEVQELGAGRQGAVLDTTADGGGTGRKRIRSDTPLDQPSRKKSHTYTSLPLHQAAAEPNGNGEHQVVGGETGAAGEGREGQPQSESCLTSNAAGVPTDPTAARSAPSVGADGASAAEELIVPLVVGAPVSACAAAPRAVEAGVPNFKAFRKQALVRAPMWTSFVTHRQDGVVGSEEFLQEEKRKVSERKKADELFNVQLKAGRAR